MTEQYPWNVVYVLLKRGVGLGNVTTTGKAEQPRLYSTSGSLLSTKLGEEQYSHATTLLANTAVCVV